MITDKDKQLIKKFLRMVPVFRSFTEGNLDHVIEDVRIRRVEKGEDIVFQTDEGTDLYILLKGKVKVSLMSEDGQELILTNLNEGAFFGEMSLIDGKSRSATVVAAEDAALGVLQRDKFINTMKKNPIIAFDLLTAVVDRLRKADDMIETLAFLDVNERIVKYFADAAKKEGEVDENGFYKIKKITHHELASRIGSSREAVSKALKVLTFKEEIKEEKGHFLIPSQRGS